MYFDKHSNYDSKANVTEVKFGKEKPVLEVELNELQQVQNQARQTFITDYLDSGVMIKPLIDIVDSNIKVREDFVSYVNGMRIYIPKNTSIAKPNSIGNYVLFLETWVEEVTCNDTLTQFGGENQSTIPNYLKDTRIPEALGETSRRLINKWRLRIEEGSSLTSIPLRGALVENSSTHFSKLTEVLYSGNLSNASFDGNVYAIELFSGSVGDLGLTLTPNYNKLIQPTDIKQMELDLKTSIGKKANQTDLESTQKELTTLTGKVNSNTNELNNMKDSIAQNKPIIINDDVPVGTISYRKTGGTLSSSWLFCDGSSVSRIEYPELFEVLGYTYGGSEEFFNLPNVVIGNNLLVASSDENSHFMSEIAHQQGIIKAKRMGKDMISVAQEVEGAKGSFETLAQAMNSKANQSELDTIKNQVAQNKPIVISNDTPVGAITFVNRFASDIEGWLVCDGRLLNTADYPELFAVIGYTHGGSDSQFALPNIVFDNLVLENLDSTETVIDGKTVKNQVGIIKVKKLGENMITVAQEIELAKGIHETLKDSIESKAEKSELDAIKDQVTTNRPIIITDDYPIGGFMWFTSSTAPDGWLLCNGQGVNISDYPELFDKIGYKYGGEGTWFRVPDLVTKQDFIRSISATGTVGDRQDDALRHHNHNLWNYIGKSLWLSGDNAYWDSPGNNTLLFSGTYHENKIPSGMTGNGSNADNRTIVSTQYTGSLEETRPRNIAFAPYVKAKQRAKDMTTVAQEWTSFKDNGGHVGGQIINKHSITVEKDGDPYITASDTTSGCKIAMHTNLQTGWIHLFNKEGSVVNGVTLGADGGVELSGKHPALLRRLRLENLYLDGLGIQDTFATDVHEDRLPTTSTKDGTMLNLAPTTQFATQTYHTWGGEVFQRTKQSGAWGNWGLMYSPLCSKANNGYVKLANGIILQWGIITTSFPNNNAGATSTGFTSFPVTFPNGIFSITSSIGRNVNSNSYLWGSVISCVMPITRLDGIEYEARVNVGTGSNYNWQIHWMAIGY